MENITVHGRPYCRKNGMKEKGTPLYTAGEELVMGDKEVESDDEDEDDDD
jgi:hypothetical protein